MAHYYEQDGTPAHFQPVKSRPGDTRPTTIRDAKKLNLLPSVTEILNIAAKPALTNWLVNQALLSALTLPRIEGETLDEFKARAETDSKEQAIQARDTGSEIHADIERLFLGQKPLLHPEAAYSTQELVFDITGIKTGWVAEKSFGSPLGYGGMVDLHHPNGFVIDFKSKDFGLSDIGKKMAYDENCMQLSAYAHGLDMPNARKINIFVSRDNPGLVAYHEWEEDYFDRFQCLLKYWQLTKHYKTEKGIC